MSQPTDSVFEIQPQWVLEPEALGSKEKFWYRAKDGEPEWLFKYPQPNTGQHWAEKIAAGIADLMQVPNARVELAVFQSTKGSASESFIKKASGAELVHGNEILAGHITGYDPKQRFHQSDHTLASILAAIEGAYIGGARPKVLAVLGSYFVLDAVIGNTDRHHENWAFVTWAQDGKRMAVMSPSFDHASSLGRELLDGGAGKCRKRLLAEGRVGAYAEKAHGAVFWQSTDKRGLSPLELVRRAAVAHPEMFADAIKRACALQQEAIEAVIARVPADWMSPLARQFAVELIAHNLRELRKLRA